MEEMAAAVLRVLAFAPAVPGSPVSLSISHFISSCVSRTVDARSLEAPTDRSTIATKSYLKHFME